MYTYIYAYISLYEYIYLYMYTHTNTISLSNLTMKNIGHTRSNLIMTYIAHICMCCIYIWVCIGPRKGEEEEGDTRDLSQESRV